MAERSIDLALLVGFLVLLAAPVVLAQTASPGDLLGQIPPSSQPIPTTIDPAQASQQAQQDLNKLGVQVPSGDTGGPGSGAKVPAPLGPQGIEGAPGAVWDAVRDHPVATSFVIGGVGMTTLAGFWLASRYIDPKVALQSPERSMLYGFVKGNPGVHLKQLSTEFKMKTSTVLWHVRKLEHADLIRSKKANGYRVFYPVSGGLEASLVSEAITALSNLNARSVFAFLAENPEAQLRDLSERLQINAGTVRWHLKKLRKAGLLEEVGAMVRVTDLGVKAWNQLQGNPAVQQVPVVPIPREMDLEADELTAS